MSNVTFTHDGRAYDLQTWSEADYIHREIADTGAFFEARTLEFIRARRLRGVYIDIGANIGNHALYFANACPADLVIAIDGNPAILPLLRRNLQANRHRPIPRWVVPQFVSSRTQVFFNQAPDTNVGSSFVTSVPVSEASRGAASIALDDLCRTLPRVDLIKIDVENHELEVLESARETLLRHRPELCIETFPENLPTVRAWLARYGLHPLCELSNSNWYFVPVGRRTLRTHERMLALPFPLHSRLRWRLLALAERFWRTRRALRSTRMPAAPAGVETV